MQKKLVSQAIRNAGSERKLALFCGIPKSSLYALKFEKRNLSNINLQKLLPFINLTKKDVEKDIQQKLPYIWGRIKGGRTLIRLKKLNGTFFDTIKKLKKVNSKRMKLWHKYMKKNDPQAYYTSQYERFKKIGKYSSLTKSGFKVRNRLEKSVADFLFSLAINFEYEPYLLLNGHAYFPDFKIGNIIIEATEWKNPTKQKLSRLKKKHDDYLTAGYQVCFFIPSKYRKFYKEVDNSIVSTLSELKEFLSPHSLDV